MSLLKKAVIFQMLMTDGIERILLEHFRHIALLENPDALRMQDVQDVGDEGIGILKVVKHGY